MDKPKHLKDCISSTSLLFVFVAIFPPLFVLLRPSLEEFIVFFVADWIGFFINAKTEGRVFQRLHPDTKKYFSNIDYDQLGSLSLKDRTSLWESLIHYPKKRAIFIIWWSWIKLTPAILVVTFYWEHETSNLVQFATFVAVEAYMVCYFAGATYIESHIFISDVIANLHKRFDWSEVFKNVRIKYSKFEFELQESIVLGFILISIVALNVVVIATGQYDDQFDLALKIALITFIGALLFARIWYLGRKFVIGSLEKLFSGMDLLDSTSGRTTLALHSSPLLARFEKTFNLLLEKLKLNEQELAVWMIRRSEQNRYETLGEISGLVAHDLARPIHVIGFCVDEMKDAPSKAEDPRYMEHLKRNVNRCRDLIESLRARLRNPKLDSAVSDFFTAHRHVLRILETQFHGTDFRKINFNVHPEAKVLKLKIPQVDLTHLLDNIYKNSIDNFLSNRISKPSIEIGAVNVGEGKTRIFIRDNGTGLSSQDFEKLTAYRFTSSDKIGLGESLGLRLTRRLIELHGGDIWVESLDGNETGTTFHIKLQKA